MVRLTEAQLKGLINRGMKVVPQGKAAPITKPKAMAPVPTKVEPPADGKGGMGKPARKKGRDRAVVDDYDFDTIEFRVDLPYNPRPKRRPRTVLNLKLIQGAFLQSRGNIARFFALLRDPETGKSRAQVTMTPKVTVEYENLLRGNVRNAMRNRPPFMGPVKAEFLFVLDGADTLWPTSPADGDADNLEKAVADALNEIAFGDDRFIVITSRMKVCRPGEKGVLVRVSAASPADLAFNGLIERWDQMRS